MVRAELSFQAGTHPAITEEALADAVNALGTKLGARRYTGTNAMQIRLLRVNFMAELQHLVRSYAPRADKSLVGPDMSPTGALWVGFTLLRQKLTNPAWYGNPDQQNRIALTASRRSSKSATAYRSSTKGRAPGGHGARKRLDRRFGWGRQPHHCGLSVVPGYRRVPEVTLN
jgi:hypothetical protein